MNTSDGSRFHKTGLIIRSARDETALRVLALRTGRHQDLPEGLGAEGREKYLGDIKNLLSHLSEAVAVSAVALFVDYIKWVGVIYRGIKDGFEEIEESLEYIRQVLHAVLPEELKSIPDAYLDAGIDALRGKNGPETGFIDKNGPYGILAQDFIGALLKGDRESAFNLVMESVNSGVSIQDIYLHVFQRSQYEIGWLWQTGRIAVAREHFCTAATQMIMARLYPRMFKSGGGGSRFMAACAAGELHELGIRMVADFFEMDGWDTMYIGANTPVEGVIDIIAEQGTRVLGISATMTYHVSEVEKLVAAVKNSAGGKNTMVLVGGYPFKIEPALWKKIGADGSAMDAGEALTVAGAFVSGK